MELLAGVPALQPYLPALRRRGPGHIWQVSGPTQVVMWNEPRFRAAITTFFAGNQAYHGTYVYIRDVPAGPTDSAATGLNVLLFLYASDSTTSEGTHHVRSLYLPVSHEWRHE